MEKKGIKIHWIDGELPMEEKVEIVLVLLKGRPLPNLPPGRDRLSPRREGLNP
jgi:hypothetical protein